MSAPTEDGTNAANGTGPHKENAAEVTRQAEQMAESWPFDYVRRREVPVFTGFRLLQGDLERLEALGAGPPVFDAVENESVFVPGELAVWFLTKGYLGGGINGAFTPWGIPSVWLFQRGVKTADLNNFEVSLHRKAEADDEDAREMLECAVKWKDPYVGLDEVEQFSRAKVSNAEFCFWVSSAMCDTPPSDMMFEKWELAQYLYRIFKSSPEMLLSCSNGRITVESGDLPPMLYQGCIASGLEKMSLRTGLTELELLTASECPISAGEPLDVDEVAAMMSITTKLSAEHDCCQGALYDVFDLALWLDYVVKSLPNPVIPERVYPEEETSPDQKAN